jgi:glycosyltransferase involved in cell wall biosynthesis
VRILLLTQVVPYPLHSGPQIKTHYLMRYLAERHDVHLVSFSRSAAEDAAAEALKSICSSVATVRLHRSRWSDLRFLAQSLLKNTSFLIERDASAQMSELTDRLVREERFDAVHADQLPMAQFAVDLREKVPSLVLDEHNAVWTIVRRAAKHERPLYRPLAEIEWRKLRSYEGRIARQFDHVLVVSDVDRDALEDAAGASLPTTRIPIAVDTEALPFRVAPPAPTRILSVATMFYPPNVEGVRWFATSVLPLIRREVPNAEFLVVGSRPPASIEGLDGHGGIRVLGFVENLDPLVEQCAAVVVPVRSGSGMRVKILEALARGVPVVSTAVGAEGIDLEANRHLLVADEAADFAAAVVRILREPALGAQLAEAGRLLVETRYDWRRALSALDGIYPSAPAQVPLPVDAAPLHR